MSKEYTLKGKVSEISGVIEVGANNFKKNTVVFDVEDNGYTDQIAIDFTKDKADAVDDQLNVGDVVEVSFNVRSNCPGDRWFTNLQGWKWNKVSATPNADPEYSKPTGYWYLSERGYKSDYKKSDAITEEATAIIESLILNGK